MRRYKPRKYVPRHCAICHNTYFRRNRYDAWVRQAPGSKLGWQKVQVSICLKCQPEGPTNRILILAEANIRKHG